MKLTPQDRLEVLCHAYRKTGAFNAREEAACKFGFKLAFATGMDHISPAWIREWKKEKATRRKGDTS